MNAKDLIGHTLGSYRLIKALGVGGMGAVYLGEHQTIGKKAAIKVLHREVAGDQDIVERFFNEARVVNQIGHPGIIDIFDFGHDKELGAYLVMDFLDGEPLSSRLLRQGLLDRELAARIVVRVAGALQAAHNAGVVHRDLKPDNIFLVPDPDHPADERVILLDFGIAKLNALARGGSERRTQTGTLMGTPLYMSPEQCHGAKAVDHRTDIYALGVLAYELFCGRPPFDYAGLGQLMSAHMNETPLPPRERVPDLPEALDMAILRALAKEPDARFGTIVALGNAVAQSVGITASQRFGGTASTATPSTATAPTAMAPTAMAPTATPPPATPPPATPPTVLTGQAGSGQAAGPPSPLPRTVRTRNAAPGPGADPSTAPRSGAGRPRSLLVLGLVSLVSLLALGLAWLVLGKPSAPPKARPPESTQTAKAVAAKAVAAKAVAAKAVAAKAVAAKAVTAKAVAARTVTAKRPRGAATPTAATPEMLAARCSRGEPEACYAAAKAFRPQGRGSGDAKRSRALLQRACKGKIAAACLGLGVIAFQRQQVDPKEGAHYYRKACDLKSAPACFNLGVLYAKGFGVSRDRRKARLLWRTACQGGFGPACKKL